MLIRRGTFLLVVGVGVPVALLAAGWWLSSSREVEGRRREARALLGRTAEVVRGVLDASLEEMRVREDARPFDAYNHVYNPPGIVALGDALALSPLARDPDDTRVVGYFQIDPGGSVRTPYEKDPLARRHARARLVASRLEQPAFAELRALAHGNKDSESKPKSKSKSKEPQLASLDRKPDDTSGDGDGEDGAEEADGKPQSIVAYNSLQNKVYEELQQETIEPEKLADLALSKKVPLTTRNDVPWGEGTRGKKRILEVQQRADNNYANSAGNVDVAMASSAAVAQRAAQAELAPKPPPPPPPKLKRPPPTPATPTTPEGLPVVDYTPFVFDVFGDELVLYRLVSSGGSRSVQGALLDRGQIIDRWLPTVLERNSVASTRPKVTKTGDAAAVCSLRTAASDILEGVELCFPPEALASVEGVPPPELGLLFALVVVVAAAIVVTDGAARRADELARQRGAFISAVSHELRTPLTTLRMHAELLRDGLVSDEKRKKFHDDMVQESVRLSHLVENVLEATRLEEGRRPLRAQRGDLGDAVRGIASAQAPFLLTKGCAVDVCTDDEVPCSFDRQAIEQIVVNLLDNAAKYANDGAPGERVVVLEVRAEAGHGVLRVLDRGPGIPSDELERVFQRFHRVQRPGQDHVVGTGLGLALVRELAQHHGGTARAMQRDGGGACIEVRLPLAKSADDDDDGAGAGGMRMAAAPGPPPTRA